MLATLIDGTSCDKVTVHVIETQKIVKILIQQNLSVLSPLLQFGREELKETISKADARTAESAWAAPWASAILD